MTSLYLDHAATTPPRPEVLEAMARIQRDHWANPSSRHDAGCAARRELESARERLAAALGCEGRRVIFTGGGTEANNLAVQGLVGALGRRKSHILTSSVEHSSVLAPLQSALEREGCRHSLTRVEPDEAGRLSSAAVLGAMREDTRLVVLMAIQNETGARLPVDGVLRGLGRRERRPRVLCDAIQLAGKAALPAADVCTVSAHKLGGPKGVGAVVAEASVRLEPWSHGGGQEAGLRPGTENLAGAVGLAVAAERARAEREELGRRLGALRSELEAVVRRAGGRVLSPAGGLDTILLVTFPGRPGEVLLNGLSARGVAVSTGSACHARRRQPSPAVAALGLDQEAQRGVLRISLGRSNGPGDAARFEQALTSVLAEVDPIALRAERSAAKSAR